MEVEEMVALLSKKLDKEELCALFEIVDSDGQAGPFWEALSERVQAIAPELFGSEDKSEKAEATRL